ncbi:hypothetical protein GPL21_25220 [Bradyrhizobium pachyrhizi]|uniref:Uncharacterized protein n=1 Tax=Bradyrhizobium pachyrhizi TaxID=280333 RepID=A0A844SYK2_9BRAD|nr:hypothetical protein [Bradyrhizobium pachyrhizi]
MSAPTARAFSSEVDTGSREENASKQESRAPFRFDRNGKSSGWPQNCNFLACGVALPIEHGEFQN